MSTTATGTIKWFNEKRGYGFIQQVEGPDVFAHNNELISSETKTLREGQSVEFEVTEGKKGPQAVNISIVS